VRQCLFLGALLIGVATVNASVIHVPADQPTIQAAIGAATNGDTVLVAPGTYHENINFGGKQIIVKSSGGRKVTFIDGGQVAPVATFSSGETLKSVLSGFTLQNGTSTFNSSYDGGGVYINGASPTIKGNIIQNNGACNGGAGIAVEFASPLIMGNTIRNNMQSGCSGGIGGAGIAVGGAASARIIGNIIENNIWGSGDGGGITLFAAGAPTIQNNIIRGNTATGVSPASQGGGIWIVNDSDALIEQNLIYNNNAGQGGGIYFLVPSGARGPFLINNTIADNTAAQGSAVFAGGFDNQVQLYNNLLIGLNGQNAVDCDATYSQQPPSFFNNDAFSPNGTGLQGTCASQAGQNGNVSIDPMFVNVIRGKYQLLVGSPAIDAGTNSAPLLTPKDLAHKPRIVDGNSDGVATIDIGAYEFQ
jgi:parallel beta-helix repeat protein